MNDERKLDATARFTELVQGDEHAIALDEAVLLIAAHDHAVDVADELRGLDALADEIRAHDTLTLARALFIERGFTGNTADYDDPHNSFLDEVMRRRVGLPITLSVLMIEIGRRKGIPLVGVGMPGHFLVRSEIGFVDPFHRGQILDDAGARAFFERTQPGVPFLAHYLNPVGPNAVLARILANLVNTFLRRDPMRAAWALQLRLLVPGLAEAERRKDEQRLRLLRARTN
jgi:regulator of sirC expression with transglutaminase-like and TPR domain